jgi:hypothetical protein
MPAFPGATVTAEQGFEIVDLRPAELRSLTQRDLPRRMEIVAMAAIKKH